MDKFKITNENIENALEEISVFFNKYKLEKKDVLRSKLAIEDTLLNYRDALGEDTLCSIKCVYHLGRLRIELTVDGERCNTFDLDDEDSFSKKLMSGMGIAPVWQYRNGQNVVIFTLNKKKPSQMVYIVSSVALALICGFLSQLLPQSVQLAISENFLTPIFDSFLGLLSGVAGVMIFLSVMWSICSIGDISTFTNIGKKMLSRMLMMMALLPSLFTIFILPTFEFSNGTDMASINFSGLFEMILEIVPSNVITPFTEGAFLQIVFIAVIFGMSLLVLGNKTPVVISFIEQANAVIQLVMEVICSFIYVVIFISLYNMILSGSFSALTSASKILIIILLGCLFSILVYTCLVCITKHVKPIVFLEKIMPSFLIALTTASSLATLPSMMETCENQYGIDKKIVNFGIPLGRIILGTGAVVEFIALSFCMAEIYNITVAPLWIIMTVLTAIILKIATPPIPGGSAALCTILFNQMGIPLDGLAIAVAIDIIADFFITATDMFCLQSELIIVADKLSLLDVKKLRIKKKQLQANNDR